MQVKLLPTPEQAVALEATLRMCDEATRWVSSVAFERQVFGRKSLQVAVYNEVKAINGLYHPGNRGGWTRATHHSQ
ncbi:hypothetical protein [Streptomyces sp. NPDC088350]|uniref:hypothetical protein n=1 Tax=Streptomyces sp. NPDC088350 TaxID=3365854 RepID=UPI003801CF82